MTIAVLPPTWRQIQKNNFKKWTKLVSFLELNEEQSSKILKKCRFPLNLPYRLAAKIEKRTLDDPILKQFLPVTDEMLEDENFSRDPVGDRKALCSPKLLHKYHGRVLLVNTSSCAMHCRYCFLSFGQELIIQNKGSEVSKEVPPQYNGTIFYLTDTACGSSCLVFSTKWTTLKASNCLYCFRGNNVR